MEKLNKYSTYNRKKDPQGSSSVIGKPRAAESLADNKRNNDNERCPYSRQCGGCDMQGSRYKRQLSRKQKRVAELTAGFGEVLPIVGMDDPKHYRNKVHHAFKRDRSGNIMSGPYERGSHWVINVDDCMLEDEDCQKVIHKTSPDAITNNTITVNGDITTSHLRLHMSNSFLCPLITMIGLITVQVLDKAIVIKLVTHSEYLHLLLYIDYKIRDKRIQLF